MSGNDATSMEYPWKEPSSTSVSAGGPSGTLSLMVLAATAVVNDIKKSFTATMVSGASWTLVALTMTLVEKELHKYSILDTQDTNSNSAPQFQYLGRWLICVSWTETSHNRLD